MDDSNMSMFDLSINDFWEWSYHILFYTYFVLWILVAYRTHKKSNQAGNLFAGLGSVIFSVSSDFSRFFKSWSG